MRVILENGQFAEDGYYPPWFCNYRRLGNDSGVRSRENETEVHKQPTLSRLDEVTFYQIIENKYYYEIHEGVRYYNLCVRCGFVPNSKQEHYENIKELYIDAHCKCGNPMQWADFTAEQIHNMHEEEREREYQNELFDRSINW